MSDKGVPPSYLDRLMADLDVIEAEVVDVLRRSAIVRSTLNDGNSGVVFVGYPTYYRGPSPTDLERDRMALLGRVREWTVRFRLLFPVTTPDAEKRHGKALGLLDGWLLREGNDHSVPGSVGTACAVLREQVDVLRGARALLPDDDWAVRLVPDTNALIDEPDLAAYTGRLGPAYMAHVMPVVLRELDDLKRPGRSEALRDAARKADRRLKGLRDNGDVRAGARVARDVFAVFEHADPAPDGLPRWLDLTVPADRLVAAALLLQSRHPRSAVYVATGDLNLQTSWLRSGCPSSNLTTSRPDGHPRPSAR